MCPGLYDVLQQAVDARKTAIINDELKRLKIDIAALQETRLALNGCISESDYTFFWQGKAPEETRIHDIGFAGKNSLLSSIEPARLLSLRLTSTSGPVTIISVYAPTLCSEEDTKDKFYEELDCAIKKLPTNEHLYLLGDFNARIGSDHAAWPRCIGHFGVGRLNDNGRRLLELFSLHDISLQSLHQLN